MLRQLAIRNYTLIDSFELEFGPGLTVLTGETGAGKSIVLDALGLILGDRADSRSVRSGSQRAEIAAVFDLEDNPAARNWLDERDYDAGDECFLRRTVSVEGRSRAWINGQPVPMLELKGLGELLVDLHGQHEHQSLLKRPAQRQLLDAFGGLEAQLHLLTEYWQNWAETREQLDGLQRDMTQSQERRALLEFQLAELAELDVESGEFEALEREQRQLANADEIGSTLAETITLCESQDSAGLDTLLHRALNLLGRLPDCGSSLTGARELLDSARIQVDEARNALQSLRDGVERNPERLAGVESRLADIYQTARKYRVDTTGLPALQSAMQAEYEQLLGHDGQFEELGALLDQHRQAYENSAAHLSQARQQAGELLAVRVSERLNELAMKHCRFEVTMESIDGEPARHGRELVEFLVATIPGHAPESLARVASGGELSRISLAIQVITAATTAIPTLVFDEVDVGIGGATADIVGRLLRELGQRGQVLCVTHLPQVAARGHQHLRASKLTTRTSAHAALQTLAEAERVEEIARMLGGRKITDTTLDHARELLTVD